MLGVFYLLNNRVSLVWCDGYDYVLEVEPTMQSIIGLWAP